MKVLLFGPTGQLGRSLVASRPADIELESVGREDVDLAEFQSVDNVVRRAKPAVVVNAAAYTNVDGAESDRESAFRINADAVGNIARAAAGADANVLHISTDFVFDGSSDRPYKPGDEERPLSVYGASKLRGECILRDCLPSSSAIIRTAWLYSQFGHNFVKTMLRLMESKESLNVVSDQTGSPTWAKSVGNVVWAAAGGKFSPGVYHWTDKGGTSWYDFALAIQEIALDNRLLEHKIPIRPISSNEYRTEARRPMYSELDCSTTSDTFGVKQVAWRVNLQQMLLELKE